MKAEFYVDISDYSYVDILSCIALTSKKLGINQEVVVDVLKERYPHIQKYLPSRNLQYLSGPTTFVYFHNILGKRILFLGEVHRSKNLCSDNIMKKHGAYEVQDWLIDIAKDSQECIDILTETPYKYDFELKGCSDTKTLKDYPNPLYAVTCHLEKLKKNKMLPSHMRYHNVDLRRYKNTTFPGMKLHESFKKISIVNDKKYNNAKAYYEKNKVSIVSYLLGIDRSFKSQLVYHNVLSMLLSFSGDTLDIEQNKALEKDYFTLIDKEMDKMDKSIDKKKMLYTLLDIYSEENIHTALLVIPMDLYLLTRLFVNFNEIKMSRESNPLGCKNAKSINKAIVYTGSAHTRYYRLFIESYFNVKADKIVISNRQCLKLDGFDFLT